MKEKFVNFVKKNVAYIVLAFCILAIGLSVTLILLKNDDVVEEVSVIDDNPIVVVEDKPVEKPIEEIVEPIDVEPVVTVVTFIMPVENPSSITDYCETMAFNKTLKRYEAHMAMDFFADEGTPVYAVYDGTVAKVENNLLKGVSVTVDHGNGLKTVYNSLSDADDIAVGATVKQGDVIGHVSVTNRQESGEGAHLHFIAYENDKIISPLKYLIIDEK